MYSYAVDKNGEIIISHKKLGEGSFKSAKIALHLATGQKYAMVKIKGQGAKAEADNETANLVELKKLNHENIMPCYKWTILTETKQTTKGEDKYVLLQALKDGSASSQLETHHTLNIMTGVLDAVGKMNDKEIVHADLKPDNILIQGDKNNNEKSVKGFLHDFGTMTKLHGQFGCTPEYTSPECLKAYIQSQKADDDFETAAQNLKNSGFKEYSKPFREGIIPFRKAMDEGDAKLRSVITPKSLDSFAAGVTIFQLVTGTSKMKEGLEFNKAEDGTEIEQAIQGKIDIIKKNTSLSDQTKNMKIDMLGIAQKLLAFDPDSRISCKTAAILLKNLSKDHHIQEQTLEAIGN